MIYSLVQPSKELRTAQVVSTSTHWSKGNVDRGLVGFAVLGALLGGFAGGALAAFLPERALRLIFATWQGEDSDKVSESFVHPFWTFLLLDLPDF